jgi:uncharacterized protein (TIGR02679 family)
VTDQQTMQNAQKAVAFFTQAGLSRLVAKLYDKYIELGQAGGQIILQDCTPGERRDIASFLGKHLYSDTTIRVRLVDVEKALTHSFNCTLLDLLRAYYSDRELITRAEQRAMHTAHQAQFRSSLASIAAGLPEKSQGRYWLQQGLHGQEWLFSRYKNAPEDEQKRQLNQIRYIANLLDQLPDPDTPERLALFAQRTSGDPHTLDPGRSAGRLFLLALNDLNHDTTDIALKDREQEVHLYSEAGLLLDTISSSVAVFNLSSAVYHNGVLDQLPLAAGERILLLPLRQLLEWQHVLPSRADIYVIENPQVFEEVISGLGPLQPAPTCVCTAGWPSRAALMLLDQLLAASTDNTLYYSGDFDLKGLQIAAYLMTRNPGRCYAWRFDPDSYTLAFQSKLGADITPAYATTSELDMLNTLPDIFAPLIAKMQEKRAWAYQEGITHLLIADIKKNAIQKTTAI